MCMLKRLPLIAVLGAVALFTTACGPASPPTASPTASSSSSSTPSSSSPVPSSVPSAAPSAGGVITAGNCTAADEAAAAFGQLQATMYTIYTSDASTPVTIHYMAFNQDGTMPIETLTTPGPFINFISYPCTEAEDEADWTVSVTTATVMVTGCVIYFGGLQVDSKETSDEDPGTAACIGNPGR
jgi:hypothetical protein